jgi:FAD/FMN-containing dehydrogenase
MPEFELPDARVLEELKSLVGPSGWKTGTDADRYFDDPRGSFRGQGCLVLLPDSPGQLSEIVRRCNAAKIGIIPYGGGTGVVAGQLSIRSAHAVIVSVERLNRVRSLSTEDFVMVAEAGCVLETIHAEAARHDMMFPLSMASKGSCTIGGNLATNAGGIQVVRHGNARDLCLGIEAVLPSGDILNELSPLRKNNTGYDLRHLLIGSEGTLGIITAASLVLKPVDPETATAFCALGSPTDALTVYRSLRRNIGDRLSGLELMSGFGIDLVTHHFAALQRPFDRRHDWFLLVEASGPIGTRDQTETALAQCIEQGLVEDAVVASSEGQRDALWALRESTPDANRLAGAICSSDTSVPLRQIAPFIAQTHETVRALYPGLRINSYGHIGDGNIHHNVFPPEGVQKTGFVADQPEIVEKVRHAINDVTVHYGGSISAEHGIGRLKRDDLKAQASPAKLTLLHQIKSAIDPNNIMNPGALIG